MEAKRSRNDEDRPDLLIEPILNAVSAIVARDGFEGATIRRVAAEAGCSAGAVQKRFASRSHLLRAAFERVVSSSLLRISNASGDRHSGTEFAQQSAAARETLPLDTARRDEALVWTSYLLRAATDDALSDLPRHLDEAVHDELADGFAAAQQNGILRCDMSPGLLADAVLALIDGIALRMLYTSPSEHDSLLAALDAGLAVLLTEIPING